MTFAPMFSALRQHRASEGLLLVAEELRSGMRFTRFLPANLVQKFWVQRSANQRELWMAVYKLPPMHHIRNLLDEYQIVELRFT